MSNDDWKRIVNVSASSSAHIFRSLPGMPSGPGALCSFTCERSLWVPFFEILIPPYGITSFFDRSPSGPPA